MKKTLRFLVTVDVDVTGGKECFGADIGEGIQMGINKAVEEGVLTGAVNEHVLIESVTTCYQNIFSDTNLKDAFHAAILCLENIRAAAPEVIADHMPPDWGMNRLRAFDGVQPSGDTFVMSDIEKVAKAVLDTCNHHVSKNRPLENLYLDSIIKSALQK